MKVIFASAILHCTYNKWLVQFSSVSAFFPVVIFPSYKQGWLSYAFTNWNTFVSPLHFCFMGWKVITIQQPCPVVCTA